MNIKTKLATVSVPVLLAMTGGAYAGTCTGPCVVQSTSTPRIELYDTGDQTWKINNVKTSAGNSELRFYGGVAGGGLAGLVLEDDAGYQTLVVDDASRVGIGTGSPANKLEVYANNPGIKVNDSDGGHGVIKQEGNYFFLQDEAGRTRLSMETGGSVAGAWDQLFLAASGKVGLGLANPPEALTIQQGNSIIRLDSGTRQWEIQPHWGNGLFFTSKTGGTRYVMGLNSSAPGYSLYVNAQGRVGMGVGSTVETGLHIRRNDGLGIIKVQETNATTAQRFQVLMENNGGTGFRMTDTSVVGREWSFSTQSNGAFNASFLNTGGSEFSIGTDGTVRMGPGNTTNLRVAANGNVYVPNGNIFVGATQLNVPDYVFANDYKLMSLDALDAFVKKEKHLPNVASEAEIKEAKLLNVGKSNMIHLEKIEELTLYTLQQHKQIKALQEKSSSLQKKLNEQTMVLRSKNNRLQERLTSLEKLVTNLAASDGLLGKKGSKVALK